MPHSSEDERSGIKQNPSPSEVGSHLKRFKNIQTVIIIIIFLAMCCSLILTVYKLVH